MPNVSVTVCDDVRLEMSGKLILIGVYPGNIIIPVNGFVIPQLHFLFSVDCPKEEIPTQVVFEVELPGGGASQRTEISVTPPSFKDGHTRWVMRHALGVRNAMLTPGKIEARVILDNKPYAASAAWIEQILIATEEAQVTTNA